MSDVRKHYGDFEPGNATRYSLTIFEQEDQVHEVYVIYWTCGTTGGKAMRFFVDDSHLYDPSHVSMTWDIGMGDAGPILAYLRDHHGIRVVLPKDFDPDTGVWVGPTIN